MYILKKKYEGSNFMALFDKINDFAKTATEKTASFAKATTEKAENAIETGKLNSRIAAEERNISAITLKIGEYFLAKLDSGEILDSDVMNMFESVKVCRNNIANFRKEIEAITSPKEVPAEAAAPACPCCEAAPTEPAEPEVPAEPAFCPCCEGEQPACEPVVLPLTNEERPVCDCEPAPKAEATCKFCPMCGAKVEPEARFCPLCGAQL